MHLLNQGVVLSLFNYNVTKSQIKKLHFLEHHSTCTMILISRKG